jgi:hypothetical protein
VLPDGSGLPRFSSEAPLGAPVSLPGAHTPSEADTAIGGGRWSLALRSTWYRGRGDTDTQTGMDRSELSLGRSDLSARRLLSEGIFPHLDAPRPPRRSWDLFRASYQRPVCVCVAPQAAELRPSTDIRGYLIQGPPARPRNVVGAQVDSGSPLSGLWITRYPGRGLEILASPEAPERPEGP